MSGAPFIPARPAALLFMAIALSGSACRKHAASTPHASLASATLVDGTFITKAGSYPYLNGSVAGELTIQASSSDLLCKIDQPGWGNGAYGNTTSKIPLPLAAADAPWFVFFENPTHLWVFNGTDHLSFRLRDTEDGNLSGDAIHSGMLSPSSPPVPRELVLQLPSDLRKLFPHVESPAKRPSL
jgi:hypothetical protein